MNRPNLAPVVAVLDREAEMGRSVAFWWRDDDAVAATPAFDRLLALASAADVPLAVATIPDLAERSLAERLADEPGVHVLVHGWRHLDHAPPGEKRAEFGPHRHLPIMEDESARALETAQRRFGAGARPIFVPPWNRIAPALVHRLSELGYAGLSTFGSQHVADGGRLQIVNTHIDPVDWRGSRGPVSPTRLADALGSALRDGCEVVGLLTHHLVFDEELWAFTAELAELIARHPAARFVAPPFSLAEPSLCCGEFGD